MIFCVSIFISCLEPTAREQLDQNDFRRYYGIFFESTSLKLLDDSCSKFFCISYHALWQRHLKRYITVEDFMDMDHHISQFFPE